MTCESGRPVPGVPRLTVICAPVYSRRDGLPTQIDVGVDFDGTKITPKEPVPVHKPYEAIVTFTSPMARSQPQKNILDFAGIFDGGDVAIIEEIIRGRRGPSTGSDFAVP